MIRWEYKRECSDLSMAEIARLGQLGWELVSVLRNSDFKCTVVYYFKRPVEDETNK
jgi:hypothetical protein